MSSVDDLIDELFPGKPQPAASANGTTAKTTSSWDSDSEEPTSRGHARGAAPRQVAHSTAPAGAAQGPSVSHNFDDDSDEDGKRGGGGMRGSAAEGGGVAGGEMARPGCRSHSFDEEPGEGTAAATQRSGTGAHHTLFTVPFPNQSALAGLPACTNKCFVTCRGAALVARVAAPSVEALRSVAGGQFDAQSSPAHMMQRKAAFYAHNPKVGNACLDGGANVPVNRAGGGGCPHMVCRKCNYGVVRLQGAAWVDDCGAVDLYLTLRNYYPDWSRLASSTPVGLSEGEQQRRGFVLEDNPKCAAYCCQCSWLTVCSDRAVIETKLTDAASYASESNLFATQLPLPSGETRRPPLWACKGHFLV